MFQFESPLKAINSFDRKIFQGLKSTNPLYFHFVNTLLFVISYDQVEQKMYSWQIEVQKYLNKFKKYFKGWN